MNLLNHFFIFFLLIISFQKNVSSEKILGLQQFPQSAYEQANKFLNSIDSESPLILTPYLESNHLLEAKNLSKVKNLGVPIESYSGFFTVNKQYDSNMFFWFFPAMSGKIDSPIILWLQGGPGSSSLFGLFVESGPIIIDSNGNPSIRNYTWNKDFALLYVDNPVGAGFSFTKNHSGFVRNEQQVGENFYKFLQQFFKLFHEYKKNEFFITGESYAGKYVPAISYYIHKMNEKIDTNSNLIKINLQGLAIVDGWCDPQNMLDYGQYLYQIGLIDENERRNFLEEQKQIEKLIQEKKFKNALEKWDHLLERYQNDTGLNFIYNFLYDNDPIDFQYYLNYLSKPEIRQAIHVGNIKYGNQSNEVYSHLSEDFMNSSKPFLENLLNEKFKIFIITGQLDVIVAPTLTEHFVRKLQWYGQEKFLKSPRLIYRILKDNDNTKYVAGYIRQAENLNLIMIRNAGHMFPYDQPKVSQDLIKKFVRNESFF